MLNRDFRFKDARPVFHWEDLQQSAPTVMAIAQVCSMAIVQPEPVPPDELTDEARTLLYVGRERGVYELKGDWEAFDASQRLLSVSVEVAEQVHWLFKQPGQIEKTMQFLSGFIEICRCGWMTHQWQREFVLSAEGFAVAGQVQPVESCLAFPQKMDHDAWSAGD